MHVSLYVKGFLFLVILRNCNSDEGDEGSTNVKPTRPRYTELHRSKTVATSTTTEKLDLSEVENHKVDSSEEVSNSRQPTTPTAKKTKYVEYIRPGATPRPKIPKTTPTPSRIVDKTARPEGCGQCRFYCKQCKGSEEVGSGGVWGCCNHNCCGGRCSCQKLQ